MPTLREIGEAEAIQRLIRVRRPGTGVIVDSGDDAAVFRPSPDRDLIATTDGFVEGRHYRPSLMTHADLGVRLAVANLSDLAAMAARPRWALLAMGARADHEIEALVELETHLASALAEDGASLVGGNLSAVEGAEWMSVTLIGETERDRTWLRTGARPGHLIGATGWPGRAGAGLSLVERFGLPAEPVWWQPLLDAWIKPQSRVKLALALAELGAVAGAIDVSDGLAGDLGHLCAASRVGARLEVSAEDPLLERAAQALGIPIEELRFGPSDDYELLIAIDPSLRSECESLARSLQVRLTVLGHFTEKPGLSYLEGGVTRPLLGSGYDHFRT